MAKAVITEGERRTIANIFQAINKYQNATGEKDIERFQTYMTKELKFICCASNSYTAAERLRKAWVTKHIEKKMITRSEAQDLNEMYAIFREEYAWSFTDENEYEIAPPNLPDSIEPKKRVIDY